MEKTLLTSISFTTTIQGSRKIMYSPNQLHLLIIKMLNHQFLSNQLMLENQKKRKNHGFLEFIWNTRSLQTGQMVNLKQSFEDSTDSLDFTLNWWWSIQTLLFLDFLQMIFKRKTMFILPSLKTDSEKSKAFLPIFLVIMLLKIQKFLLIFWLKLIRN